jgi:hypothetical protein
MVDEQTPEPQEEQQPEEQPEVVGASGGEEVPVPKAGGMAAFERPPRPERKVDDVDWLRTIKDETWPEFVERMRQAPHLVAANQLGTTYAIDTGSYTAELQYYVAPETIDRKVRDTTDLPKTVALMGVIQSFREKVASTQVGLIDIKRHLKKAYKPCEAWIKLHPYMKGKKDGDRKNATHLILQELVDTIDDIQMVLDACEGIVWTLKQSADTYNAQKQGLATMVHAGMHTGGNPEQVRR